MSAFAVEKIMACFGDELRRPRRIESNNDFRGADTGNTLHLEPRAFDDLITSVARVWRQPAAVRLLIIPIGLSAAVQFLEQEHRTPFKSCIENKAVGVVESASGTRAIG